MIIGSHVLLHSKDPDADRAFFRDVLQFPFVDAGRGWLIFALPPAEAAIHPVDGESSPKHAGPEVPGAVLYLMCDNLDALMASLKERNVRCAGIKTERWGSRTSIALPSGAEIGLYQPTHPTALHLCSTEI
jgi:predicted enzyme related to lactoylglutathione lyase